MTSNVQISGKANNGIIFVVGGEDVDSLRVNLSALLGGMERADAVLNAATQLIVPPSVAGAPSRDEFQQAAQTVQNAFAGSTSPPDDPWGSPPVPPYQPQQNQQRQATPPPGQSAPACQHGARSWVTGTSKKNGKAWKMWACPAPDRDSQCEPVWVR